MKKLSLIALVFPLFAIAGVNDALFFPKNSEIIGNTSFSSSSSELSGSLSGTKIVISGSSTYLSQLVAAGLSESLTAGISIINVNTTSSDLRIGTTTFTSSSDTGFQSPTLFVATRLGATESLNFNFLDARFFYNPKGSEDNARRSDFMGVTLRSGSELSEDQKIAV